MLQLLSGDGPPGHNARLTESPKNPHLVKRLSKACLVLSLISHSGRILTVYLVRCREVHLDWCPAHLQDAPSTLLSREPV